MEFKHYSVLLEETIENLNVRPGGIYVDGTLGGGGHKGAAGATVKGSLEEVKEKVLAAVKNNLEKANVGITAC